MTDQNTGKCPVTYGLDIFGDRWSLLIVRDMLFRGKRHYGQFAKSSERISSNILASRLARLEEAGIIAKADDPDNQKRFIYSLTDKGLALVPVLLEIVAWSARFDPQAKTGPDLLRGAPADLVERLHNDRAALVAEIVARARQEQTAP